jgi:hypothetical protein
MALRANDAEACLFAGGGVDAGQWRRYRSFLVFGTMLPRQGLSSGSLPRNEKISDGWLWHDKATKRRHWFPHDRLHASRDDTCHVCVSPLTTPSGICLYVPLPA